MLFHDRVIRLKSGTGLLSGPQTCYLPIPYLLLRIFYSELTGFGVVTCAIWPLTFVLLFLRSNTTAYLRDGFFRALLWMDEILHHPRNLGMNDSPVNTNKRYGFLFMVSEWWCEKRISRPSAGFIDSSCVKPRGLDPSIPGGHIDLNLALDA